MTIQVNCKLWPKQENARFAIVVSFSDETGCVVFEKDASYIKSMPPEPVDSSATYIQLGVDILAVLEISEVDSYMSMQISIQLTW